jgi:hypothetical protein
MLRFQIVWSLFRPFDRILERSVEHLQVFVCLLFQLIFNSAIRQSLGAFAGRNTTARRQMENDAATANGRIEMFPGTVMLSNTSSTTVARPNASATDPAALRAQHRAQLTASLDYISAAWSWRSMNLFRTQQISHLHLALQIESSPLYSASNPTMTRLVSLCNRGFEEPPVFQPIVRHAPEPSNEGVDSAPGRGRNVRQNTTADAPLTQPQNVEVDDLGELMRRFTEVELGGDGQCLFCVLRYLQAHEVGHEVLQNTGVSDVNEDVTITRERVCNHLDLVKDTLVDNHNVLASAAMAMECGDVQSYMTWMRNSESPGGVIEVNAWAHLMEQHVFVYSTTVFAGSGGIYKEEFQHNPRSSLERAHYILHRVGRGESSSI